MPVAVGDCRVDAVDTDAAQVGGQDHEHQSDKVSAQASVRFPQGSGETCSRKVCRKCSRNGCRFRQVADCDWRNYDRAFSKPWQHHNLHQRARHVVRIRLRQRSRLLEQPQSTSTKQQQQQQSVITTKPQSAASPPTEIQFKFLHADHKSKAGQIADSNGYIVQKQEASQVRFLRHAAPRSP